MLHHDGPWHYNYLLKLLQHSTAPTHSTLSTLAATAVPRGKARVPKDWRVQAPSGYYPSEAAICAALDKGHAQIRAALDVILDVDPNGARAHGRVPVNLLGKHCVR